MQMDSAVRALCILIGIFLETRLIASEAVSIKKFVVPSRVQLHDNVVLTCEHDLKPGRLYRVEWYHKNGEFYRYATDQETPRWAAEESGLTVNISESSETQVVIMNVNLTATGEFACTVVTESPDYSDAKKAANMTVDVIPSEKPIISPPPSEGLRPGSTIDLNCTSEPSLPAATLEWHLNEKPVPPSYLRPYPPELQKDGLYVSRLGLYFKLSKKDYNHGELNFVCTAKILTLYTKSDKHVHPTASGGEPPAQSAIGDKRRKSASGATSLVLWSGYCILALILSAR